MDTKLKKSHKLTVVLITLCVLVPAFLITSLYPKISDEMEKAREKRYAEYQEEKGNRGPEWELDEQLINYAVETSYYVYGEMLQETTGEKVDFRVLDRYGWGHDYEHVKEVFGFTASYIHEKGTSVKSDGDTEDVENIGYLTLQFDEQGNLSEDIKVEEVGNNNIWIVNNDDYNHHFVAMESVEQYEGNVRAYENENAVEIDEEQVKPKNFEITISLREDNYRSLVWLADYFYYNMEEQLFDVGVLWVMFAAIIFVALMAFILPFFKGLRTGWEKIFCIPFEMIVCLIIGVIAGFVGMFYALGETCIFVDFPKLEIIGIAIADNVQFGVLLALNFLGWALCFFVEYIVITSIRQFVCRPIYYLKNRLFVFIFIQWIKKQCVNLYQRLTRIDLREKLNKKILKIVLLNFIVMAVSSSMTFLIGGLLMPYYMHDDVLILIWIFSILILVAYSVVLYILLCKYGDKIQIQYKSVLNATNQMADGNLKITLKEDLGVFQPIGDSLEKVQQGFQKAVVEEAKSQSMKTELITNVSHDLKTPLTAIITYVDLLKREDITDEERTSYVQTLEQKSQRLKVLIEDLFEVSKAHSGNVVMNFMDIDIVSLMKQVRMEMSDQIEQSDLSFRWNLPEEKIILSLDGQRTYRVFENLINNALKYAMSGSRVYIDIQNSTEDVKIVFRNISAEELEYEPNQLTERFVRGDVSRNSEGSGLGLAIAKSFVELQNGKLNIDVDGDLFKVTIAWDK